MTICCRQGEVWRLLDSTLAPSHGDVCSQTQEFWHEVLCPWALPQRDHVSLHWRVPRNPTTCTDIGETPCRWQHPINDQCPGTDLAPAHKGQREGGSNVGYVTWDRNRSVPWVMTKKRAASPFTCAPGTLPLPLLFICLKITHQTDCGTFLWIF